MVAEQAGLKVPEGTKILLAKLDGVGPEYPLSREKLSPVLAYFIVDSTEEGIDRAEEMVMFHGMGHSAVIHANDEDVIQKYAATNESKPSYRKFTIITRCNR